ncbi:UNVERIFIED_CONTAM: hypothetical protein Sindi_2539300, partial [Sesamum indicum]
MATKRSVSQFATVCIVISLMGLMSLCEGASHHAPTPAPSPAPSSHSGNGGSPPSAAAEFSPNLFLSVLVAAL